jgi:hypothetical protein
MRRLVDMMGIVANSPIVDDHVDNLSDTDTRAYLASKDKDQLDEIMAEIKRSSEAKQLVSAWVIPMTVTFAEAYLQDALDILIKQSFSTSQMPDPIVADISTKWVRSIIRGGSPNAWVARLTEFGVSDFPKNLGPELHNIWQLRHQIIHTPNAATGPYTFGEHMQPIGDFVLCVDRFLMSRSAPPTSL